MIIYRYLTIIYSYRISRIAAGIYTFLIAGGGYHSILQTITFIAGTGSRGDFVMEREMQSWRE